MIMLLRAPLFKSGLLRGVFNYSFGMRIARSVLLLTKVKFSPQARRNTKAKAIILGAYYDVFVSSLV